MLALHASRPITRPPHLGFLTPSPGVAAQEQQERSAPPPLNPSPPPQANVASEGADTAALCAALVALRAYFQTHDWDATWGDDQARTVLIGACATMMPAAAARA